MFTQPVPNVFRRFAVDLAKMKEFYGDVLGLKPLPTLNMPGGGQMTRFHAGASEIKLQPSAAESQAFTRNMPPALHQKTGRSTARPSGFRAGRLSRLPWRCRRGRSGPA